jgi:hypothetical protein
LWNQRTAELDEEAIHDAVNGARLVEPKQGVQWPDPPGEAALYGIVGDLVRLVRDETESDPVAILTQFLVATGNASGRTLYRRVEATHHHLNLFLALVGPSSKGRKGTAWDWCERVVTLADPIWKSRIQTGLSSGEGVIHSVRDKVEKVVEGRKGKKGGVVVDPGVADKRALFVQPEFSAVLKVCGREGNILSDVLRAAWDGKPLQVASKNSAETSTDPHISLISHISREELNATLSSTDAANGFGNRFLWVCAKRANMLPFGGNLHQDALNDIINCKRWDFV